MTTMANYKQLCAELLQALTTTNPSAFGQFAELEDRARAALAEPEGVTDEELNEPLGDLIGKWCQEGMRVKPHGTSFPLAHYVASKAYQCGLRKGRLAPVLDGELGELVAWLLDKAEQAANNDASRSAGMLTWAAQVAGEHAELLEQRQAARVPVASGVYFEFVVSDADCCTQAEGIAPSYAQALSEGQRYLAQYQQDGLHTLEVRRVETLNPGAFPVPDGELVELVTWLRNMSEAGLGGLDELNAGRAADLLEQRQAVPVPVSERLPGAEDCDGEGRCWWLKERANPDHDLLMPTWHLQRQGPAGARFFRFTHWLPADALPLPSGEPQP